MCIALQVPIHPRLSKSHLIPLGLALVLDGGWDNCWSRLRGNWNCTPSPNLSLNNFTLKKQGKRNLQHLIKVRWLYQHVIFWMMSIAFISPFKTLPRSARSPLPYNSSKYLWKGTGSVSNLTDLQLICIQMFANRWGHWREENFLEFIGQRFVVRGVRKTYLTGFEEVLKKIYL